MPTVVAEYTKSALLQRELYPDGIAPNFICTDVDNLKFNPSLTDGTTVYAEATHTHQPLESNDFIWNNVKIDVTRQTDVASSGYVDFQLLLLLYGITPNGQVSLIGEKIIDDFDNPSFTNDPITETYVFDLITSACKPVFRKETTVAPSNKIQVNLPIRAVNYESYTLNRNWLTGWTKRKTSLITGNTTATENAVSPAITVTYDSDMQTDFDDIRFVDYDGLTELDHYRVSKVDSTSAVYDVNLGISPASTATKNIYIYYGNGSVSSASNGHNTYLLFDDFEDGLYTGRTSPYVNWTVNGGTAAIESAAPITGSYSLKHTGSGSTSITNSVTRPDTNSSYIVDFDFKLTTQGAAASTPMVNVWIARYQDANNYLLFYTWYDSGANRQKFDLYRVNSGSGTTYYSWSYLVGKMPTGTTYHIKIVDTGSYFSYWIDGTACPGNPINYYSVATSTVKGVGADKDSAAVFDNIKLRPYISSDSTVGAFGSEESTTSVNPDTVDDEDLSLIFSTPGDWSNNSYSYMKTKEYNKLEYISRAIPLSNRNTGTLGYDGLDQYIALRPVFRIYANDDYYVSINKLRYAYEL